MNLKQVALEMVILGRNNQWTAEQFERKIRALQAWTRVEELALLAEFVGKYHDVSCTCNECISLTFNQCPYCNGTDGVHHVECVDADDVVITPVSGYFCADCKDTFAFHEEVVFFDGDGAEMDYQTAMDCGYKRISCITCVDIHDKFSITEPMVLMSNAGYYIGRLQGGQPYDRISGYYPTRAKAEYALTTLV